MGVSTLKNGGQYNYGVFVEYLWDIHGVFICIGYVSVMCRLCVGYVSELPIAKEV
jgi:hypothetical protein